MYETALQERNEENVALRAALSALQAAVDTRDKELRVFQEAVSERDKGLESLQAVVSDRDREIVSQRNRIASLLSPASLPLAGSTHAKGDDHLGAGQREDEQADVQAV